MWESRACCMPASATATPMTDASGQNLSLLDASEILATRRIRRGHCGPGPVRRRKMAALAWRLAGDAATATARRARARQHSPQQAYRSLPGKDEMCQACATVADDGDGLEHEAAHAFSWTVLSEEYIIRITS
jgi:predicted secreted protein